MATATKTAAAKPKADKAEKIVLTKEAKDILQILLAGGAADGPMQTAKFSGRLMPPHAYAELKEAGVITSEGRGPGTKLQVVVPASQIAEETAPSRVIKTRAKRGTSSASVATAQRVSRLQATPEEMNRLLKALGDEERKVNDTSSMENDRKIAELQKRLASAKNDDLTLVFNEMKKAMDERHSLTSHVREEAFKNVEASGIPEAKYLPLLKPAYEA